MTAEDARCLEDEGFGKDSALCLSVCLSVTFPEGVLGQKKNKINSQDRRKKTIGFLLAPGES